MQVLSKCGSCVCFFLDILNNNRNCFSVNHIFCCFVGVLKTVQSQFEEQNCAHSWWDRKCYEILVFSWSGEGFKNKENIFNVNCRQRRVALFFAQMWNDSIRCNRLIYVYHVRIFGLESASYKTHARRRWVHSPSVPCSNKNTFSLLV